MVDWLVKWRITKPRQFIRDNGVDFATWKTGSARWCRRRSTRRSPEECPRSALDRPRKVMHDVEARAGRRGQVIRHRDRRCARSSVDFVADITDSVYRRMESERKRVAMNCAPRERPSGKDPCRRRSSARSDHRRGLARCPEDQGQGRAKASAFYANAFGASAVCPVLPSLEAYRASFRNRSDLMVLDPTATSSARCAGRRPLRQRLRRK